MQVAQLRTSNKDRDQKVVPSSTRRPSSLELLTINEWIHVENLQSLWQHTPISLQVPRRKGEKKEGRGRLAPPSGVSLLLNLDQIRREHHSRKARSSIMPHKTNLSSSLPSKTIYRFVAQATIGVRRKGKK